MTKPANWMKECADFWNRYIHINEMAQEEYEEQALMWIKKLRAAQPQPENKFNPDWDAMAVMVEEQQRMAKRIEGLEAQLAQREPEPVAWTVRGLITDFSRDFSAYQTKTYTVPLYTAPPQREWVGLTKEELAEIAEFHFHGALSGREFYDDVEAKLKEKNG